MIELATVLGVDFEEGVTFPLYLPDNALVNIPNDIEHMLIKGKYLGFVGLEERNFYVLSRHARYVPELPLNQVIGIPSLKGKIFEED